MTLSPDQIRCTSLVIQLEGGSKYTNHPKDPGGPTKYGVTLRALEAFRKRPVTAEDVKALTEAEARQVYDGPYWDAVRGDELPAGVSLIVFDAAVNCGRGRAVQFLQRALLVKDDGQFGPATKRALDAFTDKVTLIRRIALHRQNYYESLAGWPTFGKGWTNRLNTIRETAERWAQGLRA